MRSYDSSTYYCQSTQKMHQTSDCGPEGQMCGWKGRCVDDGLFQYPAMLTNGLWNRPFFYLNVFLLRTTLWEDENLRVSGRVEAHYCYFYLVVSANTTVVVGSCAQMQCLDTVQWIPALSRTHIPAYTHISTHPHTQTVSSIGTLVSWFTITRYPTTLLTTTIGTLNSLFTITLRAFRYLR